MATAKRRYLPAAGWAWALPVYDPYAKRLGWDTVRSTLIGEMDLARGQRVLDIGCATGTLLVRLGRLHPGIAAVGLDPDPKALARAARKARRTGVPVHFSRGFSDQLPFADGSLDRVSMTGMFSLLRLAEKETTLREIRRVLRPGGSLHVLDLVKTPPGSSLWMRVFARGLWPSGERFHVCTDAEMVALMCQAGLVNARKTGQQSFYLWPVASYRADRVG